MEQQVLSPGMKDGDKPDLCSEVARIRCDLAERRCCAVEQQVIEKPLVVEAEQVQLVWKREDDMEVRDGKKFRFPSCQPLLPIVGLALRTMPVTAAVV